MLVLSRQRDETIMIGDDIEITVVDIRGDKVRLGINAPTRIAVHRKEVYDAIKAENQRAAQIAGSDLRLPRPAIAGSVGPLGSGSASPGVIRPRLATSRVTSASAQAGPGAVRPVRSGLPPAAEA